MPLISVIVPVYKVEKYLNRCVDSILAQTFTDFELILVDDGSPDNCPAICDEYAKQDGRIRVIYKENGGLSDARNAGIDLCFADSDSEYLMFVDSDDWIHPKMLETLYNALKECNTSVSMCRLVKTEGEEPEIAEISAPDKMKTEDAYVNESFAMVAVAKLYKKESFKEIRYPVGKLHEDEFTTYRVLFQYSETAVVQSEMYYYYTNPDGIINSEWSVKRLDVLEAFEEQIKFFKANGLNRAFKKAVYGYFGTFKRSIIALKKIDDKKEYCRTMKKKFNIELREYRQRVGVTFQDDKWYYRVRVPRLMQIYWLTLAAVNKIKRLFGKEN